CRPLGKVPWESKGDCWILGFENWYTHWKIGNLEQR
ncbi:uncharacterized protein METZ01_LOCUS364600, partial [marine metagenome]